MTDHIYAKYADLNIFKELKKEGNIHSIFKNGMNIISKNGLIFIGLDNNGKSPYGIYLFNSEDYEKLSILERDDKYFFDEKNANLLIDNIIIDFNKAIFYSSKISNTYNIFSKNYLKILYEEILKLDLNTGFDITISDFIFKNKIINDFRNAVVSADNLELQQSLRKIIGRGKGLTPTGDDFLIGILWLNNIVKFMRDDFINILQNLIDKEILTTDISINYYKRAFNGEFSTYLIQLYDGLIEENNDKVNNYIQKIVNFGHTSGIDTLTGIAFSINLIEYYKYDFYKN